jgi:predicted GNAT family acetyltransferase
MLFSGLPPEAVPAAVDALAAHPVTAANLPAETADEFAARWRERTGATVEIVRRLRLYRLERLEPPSPPPDGSARTARPDDLDLVSRWLRDFYVAVGDPPGGAPQAAADRVGGGLVTLWEDGGSPVAMAVRTRVAAGMSRIQFVWTPRRLRRRGYAGGATTAATLAALDDGARDVVLNTDLGNATSNALYRRLGYRPIEDRMELDIS